MKIRKMFAVIVAIALILTLAACGERKVPPVSVPQSASSIQSSTPASIPQSVTSAAGGTPASAPQPAPSTPGSTPASESETETSSAPADESEAYAYTGETNLHIDGRAFILEDIPENLVEDMVVRYFLYDITWEIDELSAILPNEEGYRIMIENQKESVANGEVYTTSYVIQDIFTWPKEQYIREPASDTDAPSPVDLNTLQWDIDQYGLQEFEVVHVTYTKTLSLGPPIVAVQQGDGSHDDNFLIAKAPGDDAWRIYNSGWYL